MQRYVIGHSRVSSARNLTRNPFHLPGTNYSFIATVAVLALLFAILNVLLERNQSNPLLSQVTFFCQIAVLIIPASDMRYVLQVCTWARRVKLAPRSSC